MLTKPVFPLFVQFWGILSATVLIASSANNTWASGCFEYDFASVAWMPHLAAVLVDGLGFLGLRALLLRLQRAFLVPSPRLQRGEGAKQPSRRARTMGPKLGLRFASSQLTELLPPLTEEGGDGAAARR